MDRVAGVGGRVEGKQSTLYPWRSFTILYHMQGLLFQAKFNCNEKEEEEREKKGKEKEKEKKDHSSTVHKS